MPRKFVATLFMAVVVTVLVAACGGSSTKTTTTTAAVNAASEIPLAPAFSNAELYATPADEWITPPGGTTGQRYSSLSQINTSNVAQLKGDWMTSLNGSGAAEKYSQEGSAVIYKGVIYIPTGASDVFAVSASTGKILWEHKANLPASLATEVCCGWDNRGVAIGDGRVYATVLDGTLTALNQRTGEEVWKTEVASPKKRQHDDDGRRCTPTGWCLSARSAPSTACGASWPPTTPKPGKQIWKHYNIPGPGEPGHEKLALHTNNLWEHGGATTWNTPTFDPKLGLIYYSTANAGEDFEGIRRPGDNLFASTIMALEMKDGQDGLVLPGPSTTTSGISMTRARRS